MQSEELSPEELSSLLTSYMPDIPGYRVIRRIGKGGMSYVYLGVQVSLDRQVAIKVMSPEALTDEKSKQRFEQEAHTIAKLEHPCIVGIHEVGRTSQGLLYYVLPYLARGHLGQRDFTNDDARIVEVLRALLSALEYAHTRGIVHRDVKAENVLFDNADRPLLTDFGIALARHDTSRITTAGLAVGSGGYMAPEQARGEAVDGRADLYSVGVLAYELLNGRLPYLSSDPLGLALMHVQDPIPRLPVERKHWQSLLDRSMAKAPDNRFRNAQQMLSALNQIALRERGAAAEVEAGSAAPPGVALDGKPRLRPAWLAAGAVALLLVGWLVFRPSSAPSDRFVTVEAAETPVTAAPVPALESKPVAAPALAAAAPLAASTPAVATQAAATTAPPPSGPLPFGLVQASVLVTPLSFDPTQPGVRELRLASHQIAQNRLTTPAGDSAVDSLLAAQHAGAPPDAVTKVAGDLIGSLDTALLAAIKGGHDDAAVKAYRRAQKFASTNKQLQSPAWAQLRKGMAALLVTRLDKSLHNADVAGLEGTRALARNLEVEPALLEPSWSRQLQLPKPGKPLHSDAGPAMVMALPGVGSRPGVAFMRGEVTRAQYAQFATSTGRPVAHCRNRLAPISFKKRTWVSPGFPQTGDHPAVCVSYADAQAYAQWLSLRTGDSFRLPNATEWRQVASYRGSGNACQDGRIDCGQTGTIAVNQGPSSPLGLTGVRGNAREWLSDCAGSCRQHVVTGLGWRDGASRADPVRSSGFDPVTGFDDVGFRLVRDVPSH